MYRIKTPESLIRLFPRYTWRIPNDDNLVYLTFDDGPAQGITGKLLDVLKSKNVVATFFCLGKSVTENPFLFQRLQSEGHAIGNHGWKHIDGWKVSSRVFLENLKKGAEATNRHLFRPPYGRVPLRIARQLTRKHKVIMWDILSGDFDPHQSPEDCLNGVLSNVQSGSIIVFHENEKSAEKMLSVIPELIDLLREKGYEFGVLR